MVKASSITVCLLLLLVVAHGLRDGVKSGKFEHAKKVSSPSPSSEVYHLECESSSQCYGCNPPSCNNCIDGTCACYC
ncbi:unnamed protein product [Prunus armeniaca]|uniref:Uncharacterized protein n=1 Tax=Prunus armeniaca TaxID=36596 RepID=A0A6J5WXP2_PRUAR|nr:hypothetical protein GBA52_018171 [Prunus armeniaca]CAB4274765.1 unnamed protein product [Prunus armeniaca]CAB4305188.1 unnamed protein product [Prunus armeniaca]CAB4305191.1 unnamed protein product [Prunus armeniaca]